MILCSIGYSRVAKAGTMFPKRQARSVSISYNDGGAVQADKASAVAFEDFTKAVTASKGGGFDRDLVEAAQTSHIGSEAITASGRETVSLGLGFFSDANGQSNFSVTFRILQRVTYTLSGSLIWDEVYPDPAAPSPVVKLSGASGVIYQTDPALSDGTAVDYTTTANLEPGEYVLEGTAAALIPFGGGGATKTYAISFTVTPSGPVAPGFGNVYQVNGALSTTNSAGSLVTSLLLPQEIATLALNAPAGSTKLLGLASDRLDRTVRLIVWDTVAKAVALELGPVALQPGLVQGNTFATIADIPFKKNGRLLDTLNGVDSILTLVARGTKDPTAGFSVNTLSSAPAIGQLSIVGQNGTAETRLVTGGALFTGRKLGTTP